ncbi:MAG: carboxypeptidase regulatory-like domain-containing protein [Candidatus Hatepunaea meridiana]|nr:carboxypeptidase regulatory-like domain-containing protein [Candidatus Hatepunaea meridiana]
MIKKTLLFLITVLTIFAIGFIGCDGSSSGGGPAAPNTGTVNGRVTDAQNGNGISNATVSSDDGKSVTTDNNGNYSLEVETGSRTITISMNGYNRSSQNVEVTSGGTHNANFALSTLDNNNSGTVSGQVTDSQTSNVIQGAVISTDDGQTTATDNNGNYSFRVGSGQRTITVEANGYNSSSLNVQIQTGGTQTANFLLSPLDSSNSGTVSGRVTDSQTGNGLVNATVTSDDGQATTTDNNGDYSFRVQTGSHSITAQASGYSPIHQDVQVAAGAAKTVNFTLVALPAEGTVSGKVTDSQTGDAISGAAVSSDDGKSATTDNNGDYSFEVGTGSRTITVTADGYNTSNNAVLVTEDGSHTVNFALTPSGGNETGTVSGRVTDSQTGNAISGAAISSDDGRSATTDSTGNYSFEVGAGSRTISVNANGYNTASQTAQVTDGGSHTANFALTPSGGGGETGTVSGRVTDSQTGNAIPGAAISSDDGNSATTDSTGNYSFEVGVGSRTITVNANGYNTASQTVQVTDGGSHTVNFALTPSGGDETGTVSGRVTDSQTGNAISSAAVSSDDGRSATTDSTGNYNFEVGAGSRTITVNADGYNTASHTVQVTNGGSNMVNFALTPSGGGDETGTVFGWVRNSETINPISGASVSSDDDQSTITDNNGYYNFEVGAGSRTITVNADGYNTADQTVQVGDGGSHTVNFALTPSGGGDETGQVYGTVTNSQDGEPVEGAVVESDNGESTSTNGEGEYEFTVAGGSRTLTVNADGFYENSDQVLVTANESTEKNFVISPELGGGGEQFRFVLTWGADPSDLDSHLKTPFNTPFDHVYFGSPGSSDSPPYVTLDHDVTNGNGPETMTIHRLSDGTYRYYVHNYSVNGDLAGCGAQVAIYNEGGLLQTVTVPGEGGGGDGTGQIVYWTTENLDAQRLYSWYHDGVHVNNVTGGHLMKENEPEPNGPYTVTHNEVPSGPHTYRFDTILNNRTVTVWSGSVTVYDDQCTVVRLYGGGNVPPPGPNSPDDDERYWYVCEVDGSTGQLTIINELRSEAPEIMGDIEMHPKW